MEKWQKERKKDRQIEEKKKEQESAEAISGLKIELPKCSCNSLNLKLLNEILHKL